MPDKFDVDDEAIKFDAWMNSEPHTSLAACKALAALLTCAIAEGAARMDGALSEACKLSERGMLVRVRRTGDPVLPYTIHPEEAGRAANHDLDRALAAGREDAVRVLREAGLNTTADKLERELRRRASAGGDRENA